MDKVKLAMQLRKAKKSLEKEIIEVEAGNGAVVIEISGAQHLKKVYIDPDQVDLTNIGQLESWIEDAIRKAVSQSQELARRTMQPYLGPASSLLG